MITKQRENLVAPCGIDCGICELYLCKDDPQLRSYLLKRGIPEEKIPCDGCRAIKGNCPVIPEKCETYNCVTNKKVGFCFDCSDFPCIMLQPCADRANLLPHNLKVFNLGKIKNKGVEGFIKESTDIKLKYYKGKMEVGKGPKII
jgi:hypothetical protein